MGGEEKDRGGKRKEEVSEGREGNKELLSFHLLRDVLLLRVPVHVYHLTFLTVFSVLCMHVEVTTRLLFSASPVLYLYATLILLQSIRGRVRRGRVVDLKMESDKEIEIDLANKSVRENIFLLVRRVWASGADEGMEGRAGLAGRCVVVYFGGYFVVGTMLHSLHLPWT